MCVVVVFFVLWQRSVYIFAALNDSSILLTRVCFLALCNSLASILDFVPEFSYNFSWNILIFLRVLVNVCLSAYYAVQRFQTTAINIFLEKSWKPELMPISKSQLAQPSLNFQFNMDIKLKYFDIFF